MATITTPDYTDVTMWHNQSTSRSTENIISLDTTWDNQSTSLSTDAILITTTDVTKWHNQTTSLADIVTAAVTSAGNVDIGEVISKEAAASVIFSLQCIVFPIVTLFGIVGNSLSIYVLSQPKIFGASSTVVLLLGLTIADLLFLVSSYLRKCKCVVEHMEPAWDTDGFFVKSFAAVFYFKTSMARISTFMVVIISTERYIAVAYPLQIKKLATKWKMTLIVVLVYVITLALLALLALQATWKKFGGKYYIVNTPLYTENVKFFKVYNYTMAVMYRWVPKVIVIVLNTLICIELVRRTPVTNRATSVRRNMEQGRLTKMLLTVSIVFILCLIPGDVHMIMTQLIDGFDLWGKHKNAFSVSSDISLLFEIINSSINFIIYMAVNKTFSSVYKTSCLGCFWRFRRAHLSDSLKMSSSTRTLGCSGSFRSNSDSTTSVQVNPIK